MKKTERFFSWGNLAIVLVFGVIFYFTLSFKYYEQPNRIIESDAANYYAYLPLHFIYDQLDYKFDTNTLKIVENVIYSVPVGNGNYINPYTLGMAMLHLPFFYVAHLSAEWFGYSANGFSQPYRVAIIFSCLFYFLIALILLKKILTRIFSDIVSALGIIAIVMATNLLFYVEQEPGMTHAFNFSFAVYFLYLTIKWHEKPTIFKSVLLGLIIGMIALVRPTDTVIALVFILWDVTSWNTLKQKVLLFLKEWKHILIILFFAVLVWVPQMVYWHHFTGHLLYNPYHDSGFKFFFGNPQILISLFSFRKGWLLYTPVMVLIFPGFVYLYRKNRKYFWPVLVYFLVNLWIVSSWCLPWYGGSYGQRAYVISYSIMAIPLSATLAFFMNSKKVIAWVAGILLVMLFTAHNIFQMYQYKSGAIHYVSMTKEAYWDSFLRLEPSPRFQYLLSFPDYESARKGLYPDPVIDPIYTGKLTPDEIIVRMREMIHAEFDADTLRQHTWLEKAETEGIDINDFLDMEAERQMNEKIKSGIIIPKK